MFSQKKQSKRPSSGNPKNVSIQPRPTDRSLPPEGLSFLIRIDAVEYDDSQQVPRLLPQTGWWLPPNEPKAIRTLESSWYLWKNGDAVQAQAAALQLQLTLVSEHTVFYHEETGHLLANAYDARHMHRDDIAWQPLAFQHLDGMSRVAVPEDHPRLAAPGDSNTWLGQLLPPVYNWQPTRFNEAPPVSKGLCGQLSILVAMAAFSCPPSSIPTIMKSCFKAGNFWGRHNASTGRIAKTPRRGFVVSVYVDPTPANAGISSQDKIQAFENGVYGPLFK
ncbi:MAG: hypothetical protein M1819_006055 [Sarea resinae]|nr:MAG: hypothetical protein M1819_006055 [Sarea resinae]